MKRGVKQRARKHHFLPQALQRPFCGECGQLWYSERNNDGLFSVPELRNTSSTFKLRDFYTILENGKLSDIVERQFYGTLDNFLAQFLNEVHDTLDKGMTPVVSGDALSSLRRVVYHLITRTPDFIKNQYDDVAIGREIAEATLSEAIKHGISDTDISDLRAILGDASGLRNMGRSVRVKAQSSPSKRVEETLEDFVVRFAIINGKHSFVLASQTAYRIGNGGHNGLSNPEMEIWLPISPKRALVLVRDKNGKIPLIVDEPRDHVRQVNEFAIRNAEQVASHSQTLLHSLLNLS
ncbi:DUF4238 domain-containing protein [Roseovarius sp. PS-C2]|uniref:DUF4238 domain-containing protein n=1 Tax=Roseovarius sp. PS-C2 TaxID=2820814 RepID=UPI001C0B959D|nr:DUF4238 domain-containing protein [Roseovarius sp. PS-C2]MBU3258684.1 DUF4238 domain-containing protein [Roseovarius sp. PS-C2]